RRRPAAAARQGADRGRRRCRPGGARRRRRGRACVRRRPSPRARWRGRAAWYVRKNGFPGQQEQLMPSKPPDGEHRGWIIPIGGAEDKDTNPRILERFIDLSGGSEADIVVIPTASRLNETGPRYETLFSAMGAARVTVLD